MGSSISFLTWWLVKSRLNLPGPFNSKLQIEDFLDWVDETDKFYEHIEIQEEKEYKISCRRSFCVIETGQ